MGGGAGRGYAGAAAACRESARVPQYLPARRE